MILLASYAILVKNTILSFYMRFLRINLIILAIVVILIPGFTQAKRDPAAITDWYIESFDSQITVLPDSSTVIIEKITADAGSLPDKHGIFRILPRYYVPESGKKVAMPLTLTGITDDNHEPHPYKTITDKDTVTWKIGDPDTTVQGPNTYNIQYRYENTIRHDNPKWDEFYWNLNGNFWEIETDQYTATIRMPEGVTASNSQLWIYSGDFGDTTSNLAECAWENELIKCQSKRTLYPGEGITISVVFPKGLVTPYVPPPFDWVAFLLIATPNLLITLGAFAFGFLNWKRHGNDKKTNKPLIAQYEAPDGLSPLLSGALMKNGTPENRHVTAQIIDLAVRGYIKIEHIPKKSGIKGIFDADDTKLIKSEPKKKGPPLDELDQYLIQELFGSESEILVSSLKNSFYTSLASLQEKSRKILITMELMDKTAENKRNTTGLLAAGIFFTATIMSFFTIALLPSLIAAFVILLTFTIIMPKRTALGQEYFEHLKGLMLYIKTAEKHRQQFFEKEGIFEKILPYAIVFNLTGLFIKKMQAIYGPEFEKHLPVWYFVSGGGSFNPDTFGTQLENLSSDMSSTLASSPSSSGSDGGGSSGGGGGGGGGGGW